MTLMVATIHEMHVIGGHGFETVFGCPFEELPRHGALLLHAVIHEFEVEIFRPEDVTKLHEASFRLVFAIAEKEFVNLAFEAAAQADEAFAVLAQQFPVEARIVPLAVEV